MAQVDFTASELNEFRAIYAEISGEEIEIADGVYSIGEDEITATDGSIEDFLSSHRPTFRDTVNGRAAASFGGHKGRLVVVADFGGKTLAAGPGIIR